jgi:asparagine synthase (glutamine-hydrolysing)
MCGICGRFNLDGRPVQAAEITAMRDVMRHRGPDGEGLFVEGSVGLGHRRLSIIDLEGGRQPLANEDGTVTTVFNGEIYNFRDLRTDLQARGHVLATKSDTEVIVHQYEESGDDCVSQFRGMFAFALWDSRRRQLLLVRDRLGVKPLYYAQSPGSLFFASEIKSLFQSRDIAFDVDPVGLRRVLTYRAPYGHRTLFKSVRPLPPGHMLIASAAGVTVRRYWDVPLQREDRSLHTDREEFLALLEEAVRLRLISDVPLGAFLSGGLDSAAVTALMARHADRVRTFSIGFVPDDQNELSWARAVAHRHGASHHEFLLGSEHFYDLLAKLIWHHDEPMPFPASIPLYLLSRESEAEATVMLAGEGADEILAGYGNNIRAYWRSRARSILPRRFRRLAARLSSTHEADKVRGDPQLDSIAVILSTFRLTSNERITGACRLPLPSPAADDLELAHEVGLDGRDGGFLDRLLYFQLKTYLVALLMKQDKMSMAASIETRVPYLDHHLVELAFTLPDNRKISGGRGKRLLRDVSRGIVAREVIERPKQGFPVPIAQWFRARDNAFLDVLLDPSTLRDGFIEPAFLKGSVQRFLAGSDNSLELWALLNLELWRREFVHPTRHVRAAAS